MIYLGSLAVAEIDASGVHELHSDHLGSPRVVTNSAGVPEGTIAYGPYGELIQQTGYIPLTGYTGHIQTEPTGLIYMRGRFYSPAWHRFMNSEQGVDPNYINQFGYVCGDPLASTDPTGMDVYGPGKDNGPQKGFGPPQSQSRTSRMGLALKGIADIGLGCLGLAAAAVGAATAETGAGALLAAAGACAGAGSLVAGVTEIIGSITGQTLAAETGASVATIATSISGAATLCYTNGDLQAAQTVSATESIITGSLTLSPDVSIIENGSSVTSIVTGATTLVGESIYVSDGSDDVFDESYESGDVGDWGHGRSIDTGTSY